MQLYKFLSKITVLCYFLSFPCFSLTTPSHFPKELLYKGQPVDPICFEGNEKTVSLNKCSIQSQTDMQVSGQDKEFLKKNFYGYNYHSKDNENVQSYSYYKVIGKFKNSFVIYHISSGGGSGVFTSLNLIKREGDKLIIEGLGSGDRCNSGLEDNARLQGGILSYTVNINPFDYLQIAKQNPHNLKAYDDLAACAACCQGVANFARDLRDPNQSEKFISIDLGKNIEEVSNNTQGKYQECFNKLLANYMKEGKYKMNVLELKSFTNEFNSQCMQ